jgi:hypothetical protein
VRPEPGSATPFSLISSDHDDLAALEESDSNTRPISFSTWTHLTSAERVEVAMTTGLDTFCANSILINGKGSSICLSQAVINASAGPCCPPASGRHELYRHRVRLPSITRFPDRLDTDMHHKVSAGPDRLSELSL